MFALATKPESMSIQFLNWFQTVDRVQQGKPAHKQNVKMEKWPHIVKLVKCQNDAYGKIGKM